MNIGEPSLPIQLAQRGKSGIVPTGCELVAGDHDFHVVNLTPSVTLVTEVKANLDGTEELPSFYKDVIAILFFVFIAAWCMRVCVSVCAGVCVLQELFMFS